MREELLRLGYSFCVSIHNKEIYGTYMRGNKLRVDHLFEERKENLVGFKKFPNIVTELEQQNFLFAYFDLEKCVFVVQIGRNHYRGPYNEEEYFEPVFEVNGDSLYYDKLVDILFEKHYKKLLEQGKSEKAAQSQAEKTAIEDARYVFPNACETKMVLTMNTRSLYNFFAHRCCERAQWEIREIAIEMLRQVRKVAPILFKNSGPKCVSGPCPEGKMSCGEIVSIREKFKNL